MCGIAGHLQNSISTADWSFIERAKERLTPRGPDSDGLHAFPGCTLLHTRLSILDLSIRGHQPLRIPELGLSIVYNGEIYNFRDIRKELESMGHHFFSHSDTEVLIRGFSTWREGLLKKLNGMFAFAIYDEASENLFLARDRLGIKPLYYRLGEKGFYFSSDMNPLLHTESHPPYLDAESFHYYMSFHAVVPAPKTLVEGLFKLEPGHFMWVEKLKEQKSLKIEKQKYWEISYKVPEERKNLQSEDWKQLVLETLKTSVRRRLVSDVPVGVFLSGGLDSSLITALMKKESSDVLKTFSVGFSSAGEEEGNEFRYSRQVAKHYETDHHEIAVTSKQMLEYLPMALAAQSEPMVSHDNIGFFLLSKFSSESVKVVQSGQGADEVFAGYHWYPKLQNSGSVAEDYRDVFFDYSFNDLKDILNRPLLKKDYAFEYVKSYFDQLDTDSQLAKALHLDTRVMLVEDPVKRVDNNTMAWGLEARVPFLDHELVELSAQIPEELKLKNEGKGILKDIGYDLLPREVIDRPKGYFPVPELKYIEGPFLDFVKDILNQPGVQKRALFKSSYLEQLLANSKNYITPLRGSKLWQIAVLENWMERNKVEVKS